jgi:hypothetical protein
MVKFGPVGVRPLSMRRMDNLVRYHSSLSRSVYSGTKLILKWSCIGSWFEYTVGLAYFATFASVLALIKLAFHLRKVNDG